MQGFDPDRGNPPRNPGLLKLIRAKRERHWKPSPEDLKRGFRGWHQRGYLPHFDAPDVRQFLTFQLADAFPVKRRGEWQSFLAENATSANRRKIEAWLDRGCGECWLRRPAAADAVQQTLRSGDGRNHRLLAWVIMPNHIHAVVQVGEIPLSRLIERWKGTTARRCNELLARQGKFWQADYFDTLIRDESHLKRAIRYVEQNPVKAGLATTTRQWRWSSAGFRDEYELLPPSNVDPPNQANVIEH